MAKTPKRKGKTSNAAPAQKSPTKAPTTSTTAPKRGDGGETHQTAGGGLSLTTNQGTLTLGHTDWAHQLWKSCAQ